MSISASEKTCLTSGTRTRNRPHSANVFQRLEDVLLQICWLLAEPMYEPSDRKSLSKMTFSQLVSEADRRVHAFLVSTDRTASKFEVNFAMRFHAQLGEMPRDRARAQPGRAFRLHISRQASISCTGSLWTMRPGSGDEPVRIENEYLRRLRRAPEEDRGNGHGPLDVQDPTDRLALRDMADSNLVAVVGVSAGALVALLGPVITARATDQGQTRKFSHEERLEDRCELRELLDRAVEVTAEVEEAVSKLHVAYLERGDSSSACAPALAAAREALRKLDLVAARLSIRRGDEADVTARYREVGRMGKWSEGRSVGT